MDAENIKTKYINISLKNNNAIFLYDNTCKLCINAVEFASKILKNKNINSVLYGLKKELKRDIIPDDKFMFFYQGEAFISHLAWIKIFSLAGFPWNCCKLFSKSKLFLKFAESIYNIISRYRKKWKCNTCND